MIIDNAKENFLDILGHNIFRRFDVLPNFSFTASETNHDYHGMNHGIYELPRELLNNLRLRILGN